MKIGDKVMTPKGVGVYRGGKSGKVGVALDGRHAMGCHKSTPERPRTCAGWLVVIGYESIGARLLAIHGGPRPEDVALDGLEMFSGYEEMLKANRVPVPPRNRYEPRGAGGSS